MKKKILEIMILMILSIICMQISIFATELNLNVKAEKEKIEIGEEVKIIVSWDKGMQAADFSLLYDEKKLQYVSSELEEYFINNENGEVKTAWFSSDGTDITQIEYTFKAKKAGNVKLSTKINAGFATGKLDMPETYNDGETTLRINSKVNIITIILVLFVLVFIIFIVIRKIKKKK